MPGSAYESDWHSAGPCGRDHPPQVVSCLLEQLLACSRAWAHAPWRSWHARAHCGYDTWPAGCALPLRLQHSACLAQSMRPLGRLAMNNRLN